MRRTAALLVAVAALSAPAVAAADTETAGSGAVQATLRWQRSGAYEIKGLHLTIARGGTTLYDRAPTSSSCTAQYCLPVGSLDPSASRSLRVVDLDGDGEPEVTFDYYTGGAHCCLWVQVYALAPDGRSYVRKEHDFADPGYVLRDLDGDGRPELKSGDAAFAYEYSAFAYSAFPLQIWRWSGGALHDVTNAFPRLLRAESARYAARYRRLAPRRDGQQLGAAAAWAADEYRLGHRTAMLRRLRAEARRGRLRGPGKVQGTRFVHDLDAFLRAHGYGR